MYMKDLQPFNSFSLSITNVWLCLDDVIDRPLRSFITWKLRFPWNVSDFFVVKILQTCFASHSDPIASLRDLNLWFITDFIFLVSYNFVLCSVWSRPANLDIHFSNPLIKSLVKILSSLLTFKYVTWSVLHTLRTTKNLFLQNIVKFLWHKFLEH